MNKCEFEVSFHELRHTHCTMLFEQGVHPVIVKSRAGHSDISTTLDIYTHDKSEIQIEAIQQLENSDYNVSLK